MRTLALRTSIILAIGLGALILWQMREALQLLGITLALTAALEPLVGWFSRRGLARGQAAAFVFVGGLLTLIVLVVGLGALAAADVVRLTEGFPYWYLRLLSSLRSSPGWLGTLGNLLPRQPLDGELPGGDQALGQAVLGLASSALIGVALALSVASLGFYWLADQRRIERLWLSLLPLGARTRARAVWLEIYREVGLYVRGEALIVGLTTLALLILFTLLDLPGGVLLAIVGGLAQVVPLLGPPIAVLPGALAALGQGPLNAAIALAGSLAVLLLIRLLVIPLVFREGITTNPVLVVIMILALFEVGGLGLSLLGPPLAAALQASVRVLAGGGRAQRAQSGAVQVDALAARLDAIAGAVGPERADDARLQGLIERARRLLAEASAAAAGPLEPT